MSANNTIKKNVDMSVRERFLSLSALNPWIANNSSPRGYMNMMQLAQIAVLLKPEPRITLCGLEQQLTNNTFKIATKDDVVVRNIVMSENRQDYENNSMISIVVEILETKTIDIYEIPSYFSLHQYFGFRYIRNMDLISNLKIGDMLPAGTVLADSPGVVDDLYSYGINANILLATDPATGQDGAIISKNLAERMRYNIYVRGYLEYGVDNVPLNAHGTLDNYKAFLEVGDSVGEDGVFAVIRAQDKSIVPALTSKKDNMKWNPKFDRVYYVKPGDRLKKLPEVTVHRVESKDKIKNEFRDENDTIVNNKIVSLKITHSPKSKRKLPFNTEQSERVSSQNLDYHKGIITNYEKYAKATRKDVTPRLQNLIVESYNLVNPEKEKIIYKYKNDPTDLYRVEYVIEYTVEPGIGSKVSDAHGAKGIIVDVRDNMPYDKYGNKVDCIMDPTSIPSRMNAGRSYEAYFGAASRNAKRIIMDYQEGSVEEWSDNDVQGAYNLYLKFIEHLGSEQYECMKDINIDDQREVLVDVEQKELYIYYKVSTAKKPYNVVKSIENDEIFAVPRDHIYIDGKLSKNKITIGNLYLMLLSKVADGYLASASSNLNHFGIPVRVNNSVKTGLPYINNPTKVTSETEGRTWRAYANSPVLAVELKHRASCMKTHTEIYRNILTADEPTNIRVAVDRNKVPYGEDSAIKILKGIFNPSGIDFKYVRGRL